MNIYDAINSLTGYGLTCGLITRDDVIYTKNRLLELLGLDGFETPEQAAAVPHVVREDLEGILCAVLDWAAERGLIKGGVVWRDLFDTKLMGALTPSPHEVRAKFNALYKESPHKATDWYYTFSQDTDYIRRYRIKRDLKWESATEYGELDITINLSKPEKDPASIAAAARAPQTGYPECALCKENEGYAGNANRAARQNHRIIPLALCGRPYGFQYSPYVYYNEHCIVFRSEHTPMKISPETFRALFDFLRQFPHYTIGSNADLPIVGGSILSHDHFQGGRYEFAMARAPVEEAFGIPGFEDVRCGIVKWPMSVIRLDGAAPERVCALADRVLDAWRHYTDGSAFVFCETEGAPHNTITPIARRRGSDWELDLVLRNNITTAEHPLGVFHPHAELHHIKKENIGLIEVMGLAVLPARLKPELATVADAIIAGRDFSEDETIGKHWEWVQGFLPKYPGINRDNVDGILRDEVGLVFSRVLEDAGIFKRTVEGKAAFRRFIKAL